MQRLPHAGSNSCLCTCNHGNLIYLQCTTRTWCNRKLTKQVGNTHFGSVLFDTFNNLFKLLQKLFSATRRRHRPDNRCTSVAAVLQAIMTKQPTASMRDFTTIPSKCGIQLTFFSMIWETEKIHYKIEHEMGHPMTRTPHLLFTDPPYVISKLLLHIEVHPLNALV